MKSLLAGEDRDWLTEFVPNYILYADLHMQEMEVGERNATLTQPPQRRGIDTDSINRTRNGVVDR
ncbi:MAG: hypothetical protein JSW58_14510 [Candidatus Latescibacterota bacterium]|nr:MAG: hypothetical protein JSW58_14510 [Candidatus Latescibacterota bacterium]